MKDHSSAFGTKDEELRVLRALRGEEKVVSGERLSSGAEYATRTSKEFYQKEIRGIYSRSARRTRSFNVGVIVNLLITKY